MLASHRHCAHDPLLDVYARALRSSGRLCDVVTIRQDQVRRRSDDGAAWLNLASAQNDLGLRREAAEAARAGIQLGLDAPDAWVVLARARRGCGDHDAAEVAYRKALARKADHLLAHRELSQLVWRRTGDAALATSAIDALGNPSTQLLMCKSAILQAAGKDAEALALLIPALDGVGRDAEFLSTAAEIACRTDGGLAFDIAGRAVAAHRCSGSVTALVQAALACGKLDIALAESTWLVTRDATDQLALALLATCYRLGGDPRYEELVDYGLVKTFDLPVPKGWPDLPSFLGDLTRELAPLHDLPVHPAGMSVRWGSQTSDNLKHHRSSAVQAAREGFDDVIARYVSWLGEGEDVVRRRRGREFEIADLWSVRLSGGGLHDSHVHPRGWLSSAFYINLPDEVLIGKNKPGWLEFGKPGIETISRLTGEYYIKPRCGQVVIFPSFFWHGTTSFDSHDQRLTMAFDVIPVSGGD